MQRRPNLRLRPRNRSVPSCRPTQRKRAHGAMSVASYLRARVRGRAVCEDPVGWEREEASNQGMRLPMGASSSYLNGLAPSPPSVHEAFHVEGS